MNRYQENAKDILRCAVEFCEDDTELARSLGIAYARVMENQTDPVSDLASHLKEVMRPFPRHDSWWEQKARRLLRKIAEEE